MVSFRGSLAPSPTVRRIRAICTFISLYVEAFLCYLHTLFYFFFFHTYQPASRAWWDSSKGSAVVVYAPHNDAVARYIALRLSSGSPSSFALKDVGPTKRNPRAPYTCFVLHADPDQFSITVAQWAAKKARMEKALLKQRARGGSCGTSNSSPPSSPTSTANLQEAGSNQEGSEHGSDPLSPTANAWSAQARSSGGDETPTPSNWRSRSLPFQLGSMRRRSLGWSNWTTPDLFGYGMDMLKGWMPGQTGPMATPSGTIIPIMADVQTADGLAMINSTISAYCSSHDLLLSGIVLVPSVLCPRNVPLTRTVAGLEARVDIPKTPSSAYSDVDPFTLCNRDVWGDLRPLSSNRSAPGSSSGAHGGPRDPFGLAPPSREGTAELSASMDSSSSSLFNAEDSPPLSPSSARIVRTQDDEQAALQSALATDVVQSKALINVLFPALKRDKGRIVGLVPCGYGPELPQDPDTLSLQSVPTRGSSGKSRDRSHSSSSPVHPGSSSEQQRSAVDNAPILRTWPSPVVNTVREALRTHYRELELEYRRRGGGARQVHVSTIETNSLIRLPQTRLKKVVKWNESVRYFAHHGRNRRWWRAEDWFSLAWVLDKLPFVGMFGRLSGTTGEEAEAKRRDRGRYEIHIPVELRPLLRGWSRPFAEAGSGAGSGQGEGGLTSAPMVVRALRRLVRVFRWLELCSVPWDDLAEHVAAVSYPIAMGSSCPPTPGPSHSLLHPYTISSNHAASQPAQQQSNPLFARSSHHGSRPPPKPSMQFGSDGADLDGDIAPDFPFSTASSGPAYTQLNVKDDSSTSLRVPRTYPRELSHQDPTPLFEAVRCALTSYHPRTVYYPALSAWLAALVHSLAPWIQLDLKGLLAGYLLKYAVEARKEIH